jgi:type 1 glutamine amidotransferase
MAFFYGSKQDFSVGSIKDRQMHDMNTMKSFFATQVFVFFLLLATAPVSRCQTVTNTIRIGAPKPCLLVVTVTKGYHHASIATGERVVTELASKTGAFTVDFARTDADLLAKMAPNALTNYEGVFFLSTTGDLPLPDKNLFLNYIKAGKGFIGCHAATDTFHSGDSVDPYIEMIGGEFVEHSMAQVVCHNEDRVHPANKHLARAWSIYDEIYVMKNFSREKSHVLLSLNRSPVSGEQGDFPISWTRQYGEGRVFYTALGHEDAVWNNTDFQSHLLGGIKWALKLDKSAAVN